jgi:hypothetical protein
MSDARKSTALSPARAEVDASTPPARWAAATPERARMLADIERRLNATVRAYVWAFRGVHPVLLLSTSFVLSQIMNEVLVYELFVAYNRHDLTRTVFEIVAPLTLWLLVDTTIQIVLTLLGRGHRIVAQTQDGELVVFHRRVFSHQPDRIDARLPGSLALRPEQMGYAIDRLDTAVGRFYIWGRWRDVRYQLGMAEAGQ